MFFKKEYQEIICKNLYTSLRIEAIWFWVESNSCLESQKKKLDVIDNKLKVYQKN